MAQKTHSGDGASPDPGDFQAILKGALLEVSSERIRLVHDAVDAGADILSDLDGIIVALSQPATKGQNGDTPLRDLEEVRDALANYFDRSASIGSFGSGGGLLHKSLHKSRHKALHKSLHKSLHKTITGTTSGGASMSGFDWPTIEVPWRELNRLYERRDTYHWDALPLSPPPDVEFRIHECRDLLFRQHRLREHDEAFRRERIRQEATNDLTAYMLPLGADVTTPGSATAVFFQMVLWMGSLIGQMYKARFNAPRPHVLEPALEPYIPVPAYSAYPSNHAFQSFLIAELFARAVPEHTGVKALFQAAREVAVNREWAGLHVRSDTDAGHALAQMCVPLFEDVLERHIVAVRAEWLGEGLRE